MTKERQGTPEEMVGQEARYHGFCFREFEARENLETICLTNDNQSRKSDHCSRLTTPLGQEPHYIIIFPLILLLISTDLYIYINIFPLIL